MKISDEELKKAWNTVSEYLNQHENLTFFISPWDKKDRKKYTLECIKNGELVRIVSASKSHKK